MTISDPDSNILINPEIVAAIKDKVLPSTNHKEILEPQKGKDHLLIGRKESALK